MLKKVEQSFIAFAIFTILLCLVFISLGSTTYAYADSENEELTVEQESELLTQNEVVLNCGCIDLITRYVPSRLFLEENQTTYIGEKYGFAIQTKEYPNPDNCHFYDFISYVALFQANTVYNKSYNQFRIDFVTLWADEYLVLNGYIESGFNTEGNEVGLVKNVSENLTLLSYNNQVTDDDDYIAFVSYSGNYKKEKNADVAATDVIGYVESIVDFGMFLCEMELPGPISLIKAVFDFANDTFGFLGGCSPVIEQNDVHNTEINLGMLRTPTNARHNYAQMALCDEAYLQRGDSFSSYYYINAENKTSYAEAGIKFVIGDDLGDNDSDVFYLDLSNNYGSNYDIQLFEIEKGDACFSITNQQTIHKNLVGGRRDSFAVKVPYTQSYTVQFTSTKNCFDVYLLNKRSGNQQKVNLASPIVFEANVDYSLLVSNNDSNIVAAYELEIYPSKTIVGINEDLELENGIYYYHLYNTNQNAKFFSLNNISDNVNYISVYVCDNRLNILNSGFIFQNKLMVNYLFGEMEDYYIIIESEFAYSGKMELEDERSINNLISGTGTNSKVFYYYDCKYEQEYALSYSAAKVYIDPIHVVELFDGNKAYLQKGSYYVQLDASVSEFTCNINEECIKNVSIGELQTADLVLDSVYRFTPYVTGDYVVNSGCQFDIYKANDIVVHEGNNLFLEKNKTYTIYITNHNDFEIDINMPLIIVGNEFSIQSENNIKTIMFQLNSSKRVDIEGSFTNIELFNEDFVRVELNYDHGYVLGKGIYYLTFTFNNEGSVVVKDYVKSVRVELFVDGALWYDSSETNDEYYYDHLFKLPVPEARECWEFEGWEDSQGNLITFSDGNSKATLLADNMILNARWIMQYLTIKVCFENNTILWWDGENFVTNKPQPTQIDLMNQLVNLKEHYILMTGGQKEGYYLGDHPFSISLGESENDYVITPNWLIEKYIITFVYPSSQDLPATTAKRVVKYHDLITSSIFGLEENQLEVKGYTFKGWCFSSELNDPFKFEIGGNIDDLTPGYGSVPNFKFDKSAEGFDSTAVTLYGKYEKKKFQLTINGGKPIEVQYGDNYTVLSPDVYGYSLTDCYKYNIKYKYIQNGKETFCIMNEDIENITENITVSIVQLPVKVYLTYDTDSLDWDEPIRNPSEMELHETITLNAPKDRMYDAYWTLNGATVTTLSFDNLKDPDHLWYSEYGDKKLYRNIGVEFSYSTITPSNYKTQTITQSAVVVQCNSSTAKHNITFKISSSVNRITFKGNGKKWRDTRIVVDSRSTTLYMNFNNIEFMAPASKSVLDASSCPNLKLYTTNTTILRAGEATLENPDKGAILCQNMTLQGDCFKIYGGDAWVGIVNDDGTAGIYCAKSSTSIIINCNVYILGGYGVNGVDGTNGTDGESTGDSGTPGTNGTDGGNGGYGIYTAGSVSFGSYAEGTIKGGNGGHGGNGGNGGNGAAGRNGKFGVTCINPGDGGKGGNAGSGGDAKKGINKNVSAPITIKIVSGEIGRAGNRGEGGAAGATSYTIWNNPRTASPGNPGDPGKDGSIV